MEPYLQLTWFQGPLVLLKRKENSSRDFIQRHHIQLCYHINPPLGSGILTWFPFDRRYVNIHFKTELPYLLGATNPCPNTVHMEPFPTSVFKVLIWIFATTTKICTKVRSTQSYDKSFYTNFISSYSLIHRICINGKVSANRLSAIHFQG